MTGEQGAPIADGSYEEYLALYSAINRQTLATASDHWEAVAGALTDVAGGLGASRDGLLANGGWSSDAANTFGAYMDTLVQQTQGLSTAAAALSGGLRHATNTANQLAHNFPPQPPPPSDDPTVRNWTFPDGTTMQGTATDVRNHLTTQARKAVIGVYEDYSHAAERMAQAQAAAPVPSQGRNETITPITGNGSTTPSTATASGPRRAVTGGQAESTAPIPGARQIAASRGSTGAPQAGYQPQPEVSPLMVAQGDLPSGLPASYPAGAINTSPGGQSGNGVSPYTPGPFSVGGYPSDPNQVPGGSGVLGRSGPGGSPLGDEPGIVGGKVGPGTFRRSAAAFGASDVGDGIVGGVPIDDSGGGAAGRGSFGGTTGRGGSGFPAEAGAEGGYGSPRTGGQVSSGGRLNASIPADERGAVPRPRPATLAEPEMHEGMPMYPGAGMGAGGRDERQRGKRPKYLVQDPSYWMPNQEVVPPVIE